MVEREHNTDEGTIDCHYFANEKGILCLITQVIDGEFESDNLLFAGRGETHETARLNAFS
jgi:hypothetical protein